MSTPMVFGPYSNIKVIRLSQVGIRLQGAVTSETDQLTIEVVSGPGAELHVWDDDGRVVVQRPKALDSWPGEITVSGNAQVDVLSTGAVGAVSAESWSPEGGFVGLKVEPIEDVVIRIVQPKGSPARISWIGGKN